MLDDVEAADPSAFVGRGEFEDWFGLLSVPEIDGSVLASCDEFLEVDGTDSIYGVFMALVCYLSLLLGFPCDYLLVIT